MGKLKLDTLLLLLLQGLLKAAMASGSVS